MLECLPSAYLSDKPSDKPSPAPSNAPSVGNVVEGCVIGGGNNNVCLASNPVVGVGGNNTILEEKLREDNYKIPLWVHIQSLVVQQTKFNALVPVRPSQEDPLTPSPINVNTLQ